MDGCCGLRVRGRWGADAGRLADVRQYEPGPGVSLPAPWRQQWSAMPMLAAPSERLAAGGGAGGAGGGGGGGGGDEGGGIKAGTETDFPPYDSSIKGEAAHFGILKGAMQRGSKEYQTWLAERWWYRTRPSRTFDDAFARHKYWRTRTEATLETKRAAKRARAPETSDED